MGTTRLYDIDEVPVLVRAGAVIPTRPSDVGQTIGAASQQYKALIFDVYPGADSGEATVYVDDGSTTDYLDDSKHTNIVLSYKRISSGKGIEFNASYECCKFASQPDDIDVTLRLLSMPPISKVSVSGADIGVRYSRYGESGDGTWTYKGSEVTAILQTTLSTVAKSLVVSFAADPTSSALSGIKGEIKRGNMAKQALDIIRKTPGSHLSGFGKLDKLSTLGDVLSYTATDINTWLQVAKSHSDVFNAAVKEVQNVPLDGDDGSRRMSYVNSLLNL